MSAEHPTLEETLRKIDESAGPLDEYKIHDVLSKLRKAEMDTGLGYPMESVAECAAFMFSPNFRGDGWDSYYGPMFGGKNDDGTMVYTPNIKQFDSTTFAYWEKRAREAKHPVLKIRYADLCWEFQKRITGAAPHIDMARIVVNSTIDAAQRLLFEYEGKGREALARAMTVALSIGEATRVGAVRDSILQFEDAIASDDGVWGFSFDLILENKKVPVEPVVEAKIIANLEARLLRMADFDNEKRDPWGAEQAALRLAAYYRRNGRQVDVRRVLTAYGNIFARLADGASGMLGAVWLRKVHDHYREFGLIDEAEAILLKVRAAAKKSHDEMATYTQKVEIPKEKMDAFLESLTRGDLAMSLDSLAAEFVPDKNQIVKQIQKISEASPLMSLMSLTIVDSEGRPTSNIGSVNDDLNGRIAHQISQSMQFTQMFLFLAINHIRMKFSPTADNLLSHLKQSPAFPEDQQATLLAGLTAYLRDDHVVAAHVLVPQIEGAIRQLLDICGGNLWKPHRSGGLMFKNLEDLLREEIVAKCLTEDVVLSLRVLLTDQRGWNLRNGISHALIPTDSFGRGMTDRLLHALLLIALVRNRADKRPPSEK